MRVVIYTAVVLIVLAVAWTFHLNHELKDFEASLPEVPATPTEPQKTLSDTILGESHTETEAEVDNFLEDIQTESEITDYAHTQGSESSGHSESETDINQEIEVSGGTIPIEEASTTEAVGACGKVCEPLSVDFHSLSATERFQLWREDLTKRFGDIPEVDLFVEQKELAHRKQTIPDSEILKYVHATATLFPNEANKRHLQEMELRIASRRANAQ